ncbi:phage exclusion protein Lit family protein [Methylobacterium sp. J-090]|uniref:phage exclusion protein Lit family protein n=1 Tax=Methylobacterium sp. J-090 TaxID=2836666 RepID=UPI001FBA1E78|nr:phage exclusion protein Lit family protein [Methylobacterium sp. J-090]MCJ2084300.1 hypothetical protein [Methylobacterium sp. J-090]
MPLEPLFCEFKPQIESCFSEAVADAKLSLVDIKLLISEEPYGRHTARAQFLVITSQKQVICTWNGLASLWALSQSISRLAKRVFEARRSGKDELQLDDDIELETGLKGIELARRFLDNDVPSEFASKAHWPAWAPPIISHPDPGTDDHTGVLLFVGALGWIFRHELAHIVLNHDERQKRFDIDTIGCERESDKQAAIWLKRDLSADVDRELGAKPSISDLALDANALVTGVGLIWIALFDSEQTRGSADYPPVAERIEACWNTFELSADSAASEIIADIVGCWLTPDKRFGPDRGFDTSADAMYDALYRLNQHISSIQIHF